MGEWIEEYERYGRKPGMGKCDRCGARFIIEEGMVCDCYSNDDIEGGDEDEDATE